MKTLNQLITELEDIQEQQPEKGNCPVYVFLGNLSKQDISEDLGEIDNIDWDISDRVDINLKGTL